MSVKYSQLTAMLAITRASFRSITRSPSAVVFTLIFPLIFILVFGFLGGGGVKVDLGISSACDKENIYLESIQKIPVIRFYDDMNEEELNKDLSKGRLDGILTIVKNPAGSLTEYNVQLKTSSASPQNGELIYRILKNAGTELNFINAQVKNKVAEIKQTEIPGRAYKTIDFILPGQLGFSLLSTGVFGTAFVFFSFTANTCHQKIFCDTYSTNLHCTWRGIKQNDFCNTRCYLYYFNWLFCFWLYTYSWLFNFFNDVAFICNGINCVYGFWFYYFRYC